MGFRDKDSNPLPKWHDAESTFEAWKECTADRPCDYTGLGYDKLRGGSGIQWQPRTSRSARAILSRSPPLGARSEPRREPLFKTAAAAVNRIAAGDGQPAPAHTNTASRPVDAEVPPTRGGPAAGVSEQLSVPVGGTR